MNSHPNDEGSHQGLQAGASISNFMYSESFLLDLYAKIWKDAKDVLRKKHRQPGAGVPRGRGPEI